jgi:hypothetical protein
MVIKIIVFLWIYGLIDCGITYFRDYQSIFKEVVQFYNKSSRERRDKQEEDYMKQ